MKALVIDAPGRTSFADVPEPRLGDEDVLRPWDDDAEPTSVPAEVTWTVLRPTRLAVLDEHFARRLGPGSSTPRR